jgi:hypothetical protein
MFFENKGPLARSDDTLTPESGLRTPEWSHVTVTPFKLPFHSRVTQKTPFFSYMFEALNWFCAQSVYLLHIRLEDLALFRIEFLNFF